MIRAAIQDLRSAPVVWGGVALLLATVQTVISTIMVMLANADSVARDPQLSEQARTFHQELSWLPLPVVVIVSVIVLASLVSAAVDQRRRALALLALQGATPMQLTLRICVQVLLLAASTGLVSLVAASALARVLYRPVAAHLEAAGLTWVHMGIGQTLRAWVIGTVLTLVVALASSLASLRTTNRIAPVESLREAADPPRTIGRVRGTLAAVCALGAGASFVVGVASTRAAPVSGSAAHVTFAAMTPMFSFSMAGLVLLVVAISLAGPVGLAWTVRARTGLLPIPSASWRVTRDQADVSIRRSSPTILPLIAGLTALMSLMGISAVIRAWTDRLPGTLAAQVEVPGVARMLTLLAPALVVVLAGSCAGHLITARGRELDLALLCVGGAEPRQLDLIASLNGVVAGVTAVVAAFVPATASTLVFALAEYRAFGVATPVVLWSEWGVALLALVVFGAVTSRLVVRRSLRGSPVGVIARYAGE